MSNMTDKELRKLSRKDLLEMLLEQTKRAEQLQEQLDKKNKELEDKRIIIENSSSLAEAALKLNGIFEAAQRAADDYLYNIKCAADEKNNFTDEKSDF
jgi:hypothetical protein